MKKRTKRERERERELEREKNGINKERGERKKKVFARGCKTRNMQEGWRIGCEKKEGHIEERNKSLRRAFSEIHWSRISLVIY